MSETLQRPDDLRDIVNAQYADFLKPVLQVFNDALKSVRAANAPEGATLDFIVACEEAEAQFKASVGAMRSAFFRDMQINGLFEVEGTSTLASIRAGSTSGTVTDQNAVKRAYPDLYAPQPDKLDKARLTKLLKAGAAIPGAELTTGAPALTIRRV